MTNWGHFGPTFVMRSTQIIVSPPPPLQKTKNKKRQCSPDYLVKAKLEAFGFTKRIQLCP